MNVATEIRQKYFDKINGIKYKGQTIPVFDEIVNPNEEIPVIDNAEIYIILQDQQEHDAIQDYCHYNIQADITIKVVTKFGIIGSKKISEDIAKQIDDIIRDGRLKNNIEVHDVRLSVSRSLTEVTENSVAYQKVMIYSNFLSV